MDVRDIFRKLTMNAYMPDFDYKHYKLSFETVFHTNNYKYCCCPCAFDHEWLSYISDGGEINEEMYKKVEANLLAGKCPHVDNVIPDYVRETAVYGIHIAAAVGTERAVKEDLGVKYIEVESSIFYLSPYKLAVLKRNINTTALRFKNLSKHFESQTYSLYRMLDVVYPQRLETNASVIQLKEESLLGYCVRTGSMEMLRVVLLPRLLGVENYRTQLATALGLAIRYKSADIINEIITFLVKMPYRAPAFTRGIDGLDSIIYRLVILDKPDILMKVLKKRFRSDQSLLENQLQSSLTKLCVARGQDDCYNILAKHKSVSFESSLIARDERSYVTEMHLQILFHVFDDFPDIMPHDLEAIPDLQTGLRGIPYISSTKLFGYPYVVSILHRLISEKSRNSYLIRKCNIVETTCRPVVKWILQQSVVVDTINTNNVIQTPLVSLLENEINGHKLYFRTNFEILLYSNLDLDSSVIEYCLKVDENLYCEGIGENFEFPEKFISDVEEHSVYGHNDGSDYALEFTAPLLLECGFTATSETLETVLEINLHPDELKYIRANIDTPRSLKLRCRDVLRKHFKGRHLHQFVDISPIPQKIKDYILLKTILPCVQGTYAAV